MIIRDFMIKKNRNQVFKELKAQGLNVRKIRGTNQLMHPMYIEDWPYPLSQSDRGFGNAIYKTHFSVVYGIREI